jgi:hypothetical protein
MVNIGFVFLLSYETCVHLHNPLYDGIEAIKCDDDEYINVGLAKF